MAKNKFEAAHLAPNRTVASFLQLGMNLLDDNTVIIMPTFVQPTSYPECISLNIHRAVYTAVANMMEIPATHVPMGLNKDGLPIGLQVLAGPKQDRLCLAVAEELEKKFGGWVPPPV